MFGTNEIIGQKFFKDSPKDSVYVTSHFITIQGEGPYAGKPAVFVRLAKCNLNCSFCDTFFDAGDWFTYEELEQRIEKQVYAYWTDRGLTVPDWVLPNNGKKYGALGLVITGGEPMLQNSVVEFLARQKDNFGFCQIESNGTVWQPIPDHVTLVCSPKCTEKQGKAIKYLAPTKFILDRADCLKFVMSSEVNSPYHQVPEWVHNWKIKTNKEVYVSPLNIYNDIPQKSKMLRATSTDISIAERSTVDEVISFWTPGLLNLEQNQKNHEYVAQYCLEHGFKLNLQMHLYASLA